MGVGGGWGDGQHWWTFARFWAWVEMESVERKGVGRKGRTVALGARRVVPRSRQTLVDRIAKEGEREPGQGSGLPDAVLQLALGVGLLWAAHVGVGLLWEGVVNRTICDSLFSASGPDS